MRRLELLLLALLCCVPAMAQDQGESALLLASGGGTATITYTSAACVTSASAASANCTLGASGAVGDLLIVLSKSSSTNNSATAVMSFSGTASCSSPTQVIAPQFQTNGTGHFIVSMFACVITTGGANKPLVTWTGADGTFTDLAVATYHTSTSWKSTFVDRTATNIAATSSTSCSTGTTAATTNAADLIVAACMNFNVGETWGSLAGFTNRASSSRNTSGWYDKSVSATGTQTATVPLSAADVGLGMIAAFASN